MKNLLALATIILMGVISLHSNVYAQAISNDEIFKSENIQVKELSVNECEGTYGKAISKTNSKPSIKGSAGQYVTVKVSAVSVTNNYENSKSKKPSSVSVGLSGGGISVTASNKGDICVGAGTSGGVGVYGDAAVYVCANSVGVYGKAKAGVGIGGGADVLGAGMVSGVYVKTPTVPYNKLRWNKR